MAYLSETFPAAAKADTTILGLLGSVSVDGVDTPSWYPRVGAELPPPASGDPFILVQFDDAIRVDFLTSAQVARYIIHDQPEKQYWTINDIMAQLIRLHSNPHLSYADAEGNAIGQQITRVSGPLVDDGWKRNTRILEVTLFRSI